MHELDFGLFVPLSIPSRSRIHRPFTLLRLRLLGHCRLLLVV